MRNPFRRKKKPQQIGREAEQLLANDLYGESFEAVESVITNAILTASIDSQAERDRVINLVMRWQNLVGTKSWLDNQVQFGRLAEQRENEKELAKKSAFNRRGL